jgi:hypothetical protein
MTRGKALIFNNLFIALVSCMLRCADFSAGVTHFDGRLPVPSSLLTLIPGKSSARW